VARARARQHPADAIHALEQEILHTIEGANAPRHPASGDSASARLIGRDQVWFTEKRADGSTRLYPLCDLDPRKEEAIGRRYLSGRYGATPILSHQEFDASAELTTSGDRS
jgi:hypothetical protein